jgi:hypothetical protein
MEHVRVTSLLHSVKEERYNLAEAVTKSEALIAGKRQWQNLFTGVFTK